MRFRSIGESGKNIGDYLTKIKEVENSFWHESILAHINMISLENDIEVKEGSLSSNSIYKITLFKQHKRKKTKTQYYRKKFCIQQRTNKSDVNNVNNTIINSE